jgi:hypothetical protein
VSRRRRIPQDPEERATWFLRSELGRPDGHLPCGQHGCPDCHTALGAWEAVFLSIPIRAGDVAASQTRALIRAYYEAERPFDVARTA